MSSQIELTVVMPCLNEAGTLATCIRKAHAGMQSAGVSGEILIADNGSTDGSREIAENVGARVIRVPEKGYGNALRAGIEAAAGRWIIVGDSDDSYDFSQIKGFVEKFREGYDLVMGCRLPAGGGSIAPGAMPWRNRWIGNPALTFIGRLFFSCPVHDFHCGLRGLTIDAYREMELKTTGMEFASEMVIMATFRRLRIAEVPITLHPDGRARPPHLKPWRDGWRHLRFMLIYSPRWLFLFPGLGLSIGGGLLALLLAIQPWKIGNVQFDVGTLLVACMATIVGIQLTAFAFFTKVFAISEGLLPQDERFSRLFVLFSLEKGILAGITCLLAGGLLLLRGWWVWRTADYGVISYSDNMRLLVPSVTLIVVGTQVVFSSFFMSVLGLKTGSRQPPSLLNSESEKNVR